MNKRNDERTRNHEGVKEMRWNSTPSYTRRRVVRPFASPALSVLALLGSLAMASPAAAQYETSQDIKAAKAAFEQGMADFEAGRYDKGCPALAESLRLDPRAGTLFTLAVCESRWGRFATAMKRFDEYMRLYESLPPNDKARQAERFKMAQLERIRVEQSAPVLTLRMPSDAPLGTVVKRNGEVVDRAQFNTEVAVDPGEVVVSTQAPGGPVWEQRINLEKGQAAQVALEVKPVPQPTAQPTRPPIAVQSQPHSLADQSGRERRTAAYIAGGVGGAVLVLGGFMGVVALGKQREAGNNATASSLGAISIVGIGIGLGGLGTATVLLLTEPEQAKTEALVNQRTTTRSHGRWMSAGLLSAGPNGALAGVQGAF